MTAAGAQIACPADAAVGLRVDMALLEKCAALWAVKPVIVSELVVGRSDRTVASVPAPFRRDLEITAARAARVWRACAAMQLLQRNRKIAERNLVPVQDGADLRTREPQQRVEIARPICRCEGITGRRGAQWRNADLMEAERADRLEGGFDIEVVARHRGARGDPRPPGVREQRPDVPAHGLEARLAAEHRALRVLHGSAAVDAHSHGEGIFAQQRQVIRAQQGRVGGHREADVQLARMAGARCIADDIVDQRAVGERLAIGSRP